MKWFFTPDVGQFGAAIEMDDTGNLHRIAFCAITPDGQMAFIKWIPPLAGMCAGSSYQVGSMTLYETSEEQAAKLRSIFGSLIMPANGSGPRLIK